MPPHTYDAECEMLARHFLTDEANVPEAAFKELAERLQWVAEVFIEFDLPVHINGLLSAHPYQDPRKKDRPTYQKRNRPG